MTFKLSDDAARQPATPRPPAVPSMARPLKIVVAGGFAAGKTTLVDTISEITPLTTEAAMTSVALGVDNSGEVTTKTTTTVAMDFGRITLGSTTVLYLFGTPGQDRFWFMWDELSKGAVGAVVVVDTRRLADCFPALDYFDQKNVPYVVALNTFDGRLVHSPDAVREALTVPAEIPILATDARERGSVKACLVELVRHAINRKQVSASARV